MDEKELYINFDEYIRQGEPDQKEKAGYWQAAIGLQAVDGLKVSGYLHIHPTEEWSVQPNLATPQVSPQVSPQVTRQVTRQAPPSSPEVSPNGKRISAL